MKDWEMTVTPAYGKDYKTADDVFAAWMRNKDFYIMTPGYPSYLNKEDAEIYGLPNDIVRIRYSNSTLLLVVQFDKTTRTWKQLLNTEEVLEDEDIHAS